MKNEKLNKKQTTHSRAARKKFLPLRFRITVALHLQKRNLQPAKTVLRYTFVLPRSWTSSTKPQNTHTRSHYGPLYGPNCECVNKTKQKKNRNRLESEKSDKSAPLSTSLKRPHPEPDSGFGPSWERSSPPLTSPKKTHCHSPKKKRESFRPVQSKVSPKGIHPAGRFDHQGSSARPQRAAPLGSPSRRNFEIEAGRARVVCFSKIVRAGTHRSGRAGMKRESLTHAARCARPPLPKAFTYTHAQYSIQKKEGGFRVIFIIVL